VKQGHEIAHHLKDTLRKEIPQIGNILIHVEPNE
ncbi:MAG: dimerization domain of Zinc Transporter, partial [Segetibacter sp.]|nr:dimerization domain of Zinc Transporter [Segetibacter sp.]